MKRNGMSTWLMAGMGIIASLVLIVSCGTPDEGMTAKIKAKMAADTTVKASQIEVETRNSVVTLKGNVDSQEAKDRAIELARSTNGVIDVVDMIAVRTSAETGNAPEPKRTLGEHIDDAAITASVKTRLLADPDVKGMRIDVDTREGVVYLTGTGGSQAERDKAVRLARETEHVKDVQPNLTIKKG